MRSVAAFRRPWILVLVACLSFLLVGAAGTLSPVSAQYAGAALRGKVVDSSDGVIPGATVTLRSETTNEEWSTVSNAQGTFLFPFLVAGRFTLKVQMEGFKDHYTRGLNLSAGSVSEVCSTLDVGQMSERVTVESASAVRQVESASAVLQADQIANLPLASRRFTTLLKMLPGATVDGRIFPMKEDIHDPNIDESGQFTVEGRVHVAHISDDSLTLFDTKYQRAPRWRIPTTRRQAAMAWSHNLSASIGGRDDPYDPVYTNIPPKMCVGVTYNILIRLTPTAEHSATSAGAARPQADESSIRVGAHIKVRLRSPSKAFDVEHEFPDEQRIPPEGAVFRASVTPTKSGTRMLYLDIAEMSNGSAVRVESHGFRIDVCANAVVRLWKFFTDNLGPTVRLIPPLMALWGLLRLLIALLRRWWKGKMPTEPTPTSPSEPYVGPQRLVLLRPRGAVA